MKSLKGPLPAATFTERTGDFIIKIKFGKRVALTKAFDGTIGILCIKPPKKPKGENMDLREFLKRTLEANDFDGLCCDNCSCEIVSLMPCEENPAECEPGHKIPCPGPVLCEVGGDCEWHMEPGPRKCT